MKIKIKPSRLSGRVTAPASKSMAHRLLICAGISEGESLIENVQYSEDILATLDCLETLGAEITRGEDFVKIRGADARKSKGGIFPCRESGSTLRFFVPLAMLSEGKSLFVGSERLMERPMKVYADIAAKKELYYERTDEGIAVSGELEGGDFSVRGDISSQFITGLLFALPLCRNDSRIILTGKAESLSYIEMTVAAQRLFGVEIKKECENTFFIKGGQSYKSGSFTVEGDYSNAAFLEAFDFIGGEVEVTGLSEESLQGDRVFTEYAKKLKNGFAELDVSDCPDLAPVLMVLACQFNGAKLMGTRRLKIKESDRAGVMRQELSKLGAKITVHENEVLVEKAPLHSPSEELYGHNDHRVVMSLAVLSSLYGGTIDGCEAVRKSYPDFFDRMRELGMEVETYDD